MKNNHSQFENQEEALRQAEAAKKKKPHKVSGRSVLGLKKIIEEKARKKENSDRK